MRVEDIAQQVAQAVHDRGVDDVEVMLSFSRQALTRFANNAIHQNVAESVLNLSVRPRIDGRTARASTNRVDADGVREVVDQAIALTRLTEPDEESLPMAKAEEYGEVYRWSDATARVTPSDRAKAVAEAIAAVESAGQTAAGIYSTDATEYTLLNSRGVHAHYRETMARFSITAMGAGSSGWAKASACDHGDIDPLELAISAARKGSQSAAHANCRRADIP